MDYLALATRLADDAAGVDRSSDLLGLRGRALRMYKRGFADAMYKDLQIAMDNAIEARMLWTEVVQLELPMIRMAA